MKNQKQWRQRNGEQKMKQYRGLTKEGKWVYGWYMEHPFSDNPAVNVSVIVQNERPYEVIPETVGRQPGINDKNGKEIYEGDIVLISNNKYVCKYRTTLWSGEFRFMILPHKKWFDGSDRDKEIIGNIHQPEPKCKTCNDIGKARVICRPHDEEIPQYVPCKDCKKKGRMCI